MYVSIQHPDLELFELTGKWQNNQQFDGGHSAVEVEVEKQFRYETTTMQIQRKSSQKLTIMYELI